jgi:SAM-dependent methyltransferase
VNPEEFEALARVEREHWFYRGKRDLVRHWVDALAPLRDGDLVVDIGAGTGQLLAELGGVCRAVGIEAHPQGLAIAAGKPVRLIQGSILDLPLASDRAAVVTALDVLEHVDDDARALGELLRITRPGGLVIVHVPAFAVLWSDWDVALGHRRRYTRPTLLELVRRFPLRVRHCAYVNTAAFLPILVYRALRVRAGVGGGRRLEDDVPPPALNRLLHWSFVTPARWGWLSPPFGVSILCILQKPGPGPREL